MESPDGWDRLTASLSLWRWAEDPSAPAKAWAFLTDEGLLDRGRSDVASFAHAIEEEQARDEVTGPSLSARIASRLRKAGATLPAAKLPDPWAAWAKARAAARP